MTPGQSRLVPKTFADVEPIAAGRIETLVDGLRADFTDEACDARLLAYGTPTGVMIEAATAPAH